MTDMDPEHGHLSIVGSNGSIITGFGHRHPKTPRISALKAVAAIISHRTTLALASQGGTDTK
jgi:citrate synthase